MRKRLRSVIVYYTIFLGFSACTSQNISPKPRRDFSTFENIVLVKVSLYRRRVIWKCARVFSYTY